MTGVSDEELEWDLREQRIQTIGQLVAYVRDAQMTAATNTSVESLRQYLTAIQGMLQDIRQNVKRQAPDIDVDEIDKQIRAVDRRLSGDVPQNDLRQIYNDLLDLENKVQNARVEAGLDIPVKQKLEFGKTRGDNND